MIKYYQKTGNIKTHICRRSKLNFHNSIVDIIDIWYK